MAQLHDLSNSLQSGLIDKLFAILILQQIKGKKMSGWPFKLDHTCSWAYNDLALTPEECKIIIQHGNSLSFVPGLVNVPEPNYSDYRSCEIADLHPCKKTEFLYQRITAIVESLNEEYFKFDLYGMVENIQLIRYTAPADSYNLHVDNGHGIITRKLSVVIQLSDPDDYEGGCLKLSFSNTPLEISKNQGYMVVFPSYTMHQVTPVTRGTRYSLVAWITGPSFK